ncbi:hypothetical protein MLD38_028127 [Melastoma candidum]|uniref:Uncharacterized protein n=1 Tax=Melastoma candidum TaxID=119954 RepID=A0ACB9N650_9MYRT|nr:hypothetical protein MLD38_028127 [Melastoma candidum]
MDEEVGYVYGEGYVENSRGVKLFACSWLPPSPKALVFICHGYGMDCSGFMRDKNFSWCSECGTRLARSGYGVFGLDYEGHGRSMGAWCYIKKFDNIVNDCNDFFKSICNRSGYRGKCRFLYGESMGGAVALLLHKKDPTFWTGAVLVAPMCKISDKVKPHPVFKDPVKQEQLRNNKLIYQDKPKLKTALEMLRTSMRLEHTLHEVTIPFFVLHREADVVTDPEVSKALYEQASSSDMTLRLYPRMWHGLTAGEPDHNIEIVFSDVISWLNRRCHSTNNNNALEKSPPLFSLNGKAPPMVETPLTPTTARQKRHKNSSYLCGLKGRGFVPPIGYVITTAAVSIS